MLRLCAPPRQRKLTCMQYPGEIRCLRALPKKVWRICHATRRSDASSDRTERESPPGPVPTVVETESGTCPALLRKTLNEMTSE